MITMDCVLRILKSASLFGCLMALVFLFGNTCRGADKVDAEKARSKLFFDAVRDGSVKEVQKFIDSGIDVNSRDDNKWTALHWAAETQSVAVMRLLIKAGADAKAEHGLNGTALHRAAIRGPAESVRELLKAGADVNNASRNLEPTPLHCAAECCNAENVKLLIAAGATIDSGETTALTLACRAAVADQTEAIAMIQMLIDAGANLDPPGNSPLHWVRSRAVAKLLIDAGADVNHRNKLGESPLHLAPGAHWGPRAAEFKLMIAAGAEINARDKNRSTPLHRAVMCDLPDVVQVLIDAGANVNARNLDGDTPLSLAELIKSTEVVKLLTAAGADDGRTALSQAVVRGDLPRVKELIASGAQVNEPGPRKRLALHFASESSQHEIARALIGARADVNCQDAEGLTPLHLATTKAMGQILLDAGAKTGPKPESPHGTPLFRAATQGHRDVTELILKHDKAPVPKTLIVLVTYYGQVDVLQLLLDRGGSPDASMSEYGPTALLVAATGALADVPAPETVTLETRLRLAKLLLKTGADVNCTSSIGFEGFTPLHAAAELGETQMLKLLLQCDADPKAAGTGNTLPGVTPLHLAAKRGHIAAVEALLAAGADINSHTERTQESPPRTAVDFAQSKDLRGLLFKRGGKSFAELGK